MRPLRAFPVAVPTAPSAYERAFAELIGGDVAAFSFWKGRVALYAILRALGIGRGDEVILPGFTCVVVPHAVLLAGATPVYADIDAGGWNMDPACAERLITAQTKAIIVQHTFGCPAALDDLMALGAADHLDVIEDCAHTVAGAYRGRRLGTIGRAGFFSSQWSKPYTTGLGGVAVSADAELAQRLGEVQGEFREPPAAARLRLGVQYALYSRFFTSRRYWLAQDALRAASKLGLFVGSSSEGELVGERPQDHDWLMSTAQQRAGQRLLPSVAGRSAHADALAERYERQLRGEGFLTPVRSPDAPLLRYPTFVANKTALLAASRSERIELGSWFESPLHPIGLELHGRYGYAVGQCPNAERAAEQIVNLPLHAGVTPADADRIARFVVSHADPPSQS
jgi:perosamine synthetase